MPSRMSSAVSVTPFGERLCVSMKLRIALPSPARRPFSCVPPDAGRNAVDVAAQVLVGRLGPLQDEIEPQPGLVVLARQRERRVVHRLRVAAPSGSSSDSRRCPRRAGTSRASAARRLGRLVLEGDLEALVQVARDLEPLADDRGVELGLRKDRRIGTEEDRRARAARRAELLHAADGIRPACISAPTWSRRAAPSRRARATTRSRPTRRRRADRRPSCSSDRRTCRRRAAS